MQTERIILCGGAKPSGGTGAAPVLALNLWEAVGPTNVWLEIEHLHEKLWRDVPPKFQDLLEIAAYVYSCDASTRRGQQEVDTFGAHWQRRLSLHIPVREPAFWSSKEVQAALRGTLEFLSDDYYDFTFYGAAGAPAVQQFFKLETGDGPLNRPERVTLFSGGLDSLAGAVEDGCGEQRKVLLVNHRSTDKFCRRHEALTRALLEKVRPVPMSQVRVLINKAARLGTEYTQRARSFLYASMGATVAKMMELDELTFFENGVVSLNLPVCAQVVGGRATRTTHPRVIRGMERLLTLVADGRPFRLRTPFLWDTKAEVVKRILKHGAGPLIALSRSCAETIHRSNDQPHCGVCSQCIDRRVGVIAAGGEEFDPQAGYAVDVFTESLPKDADKIMAASYVERANEVARFRTAAQFVGAFPEVLRALRHMDGEPTGLAGRVLQLYQRHAGEVTAALDVMVRRHAKAIRERTLAADCLLRIIMDARSVEVVPAVAVGGNGAEGPAAAPAKAQADTPAYQIRQEFVRRRRGKHDRTEVSTWRIRFGGSEVLMPPWVSTEYLIYMMRNQGEEFDAAGLVEAVRKSMPGGGNGNGDAAKEILHGQDGNGSDPRNVRGRIGDANERDVIWSEKEIADCLRRIKVLKQEMQSHEKAGDRSSDGYLRLKETLEEQVDLLTANAREVKGKWVPKEYQKGTFQDKAALIGKQLRALLNGPVRTNCRPLFDHLNDRETLVFGVKNRYRPKPRIEWDVVLMGGKKGM